MATRWFAFVAGVVFLVIGVSGFLPSMSTERETPDLVIEADYRDLYGLFPVNIVHNTVHVVVGVLGMVSSRHIAVAETYSRSMSIFYGALTFMGLVPMLDTTFDLVPVFGHNVWLHALAAVTAGYFGWFAGLRDAAMQPKSSEVAR